MWAPTVHALANASNASFHELVVPLSQMVKLTYTATTGTYYNASEANMTVPGWERPDGFTHNPSAGMRALLFVQTPRRVRGVVAFRGTDLGVGDSADADRCADALLFGRVPPADCRRFSPATLDYWSAARDFVARIRASFPTLDLLFSGHSLGAALALAVAASENSSGTAPRPAVTFAAPAWLRILAKAHLAPPPFEVAQRLLYALADQYDPVQRQAEEQKGLVGTSCLWSSPATVACEMCFAREPLNTTSPPCTLCFEQRHIYKHYLVTDVPGDRPPCRAVWPGGL